MLCKAINKMFLRERLGLTTSFLLELDQSCSAGVFSALTLGVPSLANRVNINSCFPSKSEQAYSHLMSVVTEYVQKYIDEYEVITFIGPKEKPRFSRVLLKTLSCRLLFKK